MSNKDNIKLYYISPSKSLPIREENFQYFKKIREVKEGRKLKKPERNDKKPIKNATIKNKPNNHDVNKKKNNTINNQQNENQNEIQIEEKKELISLEKENNEISIQLKYLKRKKKEIENKIQKEEMQKKKNNETIKDLDKKLASCQNNNKNLIKNIDSTILYNLLISNYNNVLFIDNENNNKNFPNLKIEKFSHIFYSKNNIKLLDDKFIYYKKYIINEYYNDFCKQGNNENYFIFYINQNKENEKDIINYIKNLEKNINSEIIDNNCILYTITKNNLVKKKIYSFKMHFLDFEYHNLKSMITYIKQSKSFNINNKNSQLKKNEHIINMKIIKAFDREKPRKILIIYDIKSDFLNNKLFNDLF